MSWLRNQVDTPDLVLCEFPRALGSPLRGGLGGISASLSRLRREDHFHLCARHDGARDPGHLEDIHGVDASPAPISRITDAVMDAGLSRCHHRRVCQDCRPDPHRPFDPGLDVVCLMEGPQGGGQGIEGRLQRRRGPEMAATRMGRGEKPSRNPVRRTLSNCLNETRPSTRFWIVPPRRLRQPTPRGGRVT